MKTLITPLVILALLVLLPAVAMSDVTDEPGYIDLEWIEIPDDAYEIQDIDLGPALLSIAADAEEDGQDELAEALTMIRSIRVKSFSVDSERSAREADRAVSRLTRELKENDWKRLIYVRDEEETVTVSTKKVKGKMVGLMVVAYEERDEATFVNIVGDLDIAQLLRFAMGMDEFEMDAVMEELEDYADEDRDHRRNRRYRDDRDDRDDDR